MEAHIKNYLKATGKGIHDQFLCEWCGSSIMVSFHHILPRSQGGGDEFENIMPLCGDLGEHKGCHDKAHLKSKPYLSYEVLKKKHMALVSLIKKL